MKTLKELKAEASTLESMRREQAEKEMLSKKIWEMKHPTITKVGRGIAGGTKYVGTAMKNYMDRKIAEEKKRVAMKPIAPKVPKLSPAGYTIVKKGRKKIRKYYYNKPGKAFQPKRQKDIFGDETFGGAVNFGNDFGGDILRM